MDHQLVELTMTVTSTQQFSTWMGTASKSYTLVHRITWTTAL